MRPGGPAVCTFLCLASASLARYPPSTSPPLTAKQVHQAVVSWRSAVPNAVGQVQVSPVAAEGLGGLRVGNTT